MMREDERRKRKHSKTFSGFAMVSRAPKTVRTPVLCSLSYEGVGPKV
jgi:hypothetical protein